MVCIAHFAPLWPLPFPGLREFQGCFWPSATGWDGRVGSKPSWVTGEKLTKLGASPFTSESQAGLQGPLKTTEGAQVMWWQVLAQPHRRMGAPTHTPAIPGMRGVAVPSPFGCDMGQTLVMLTLRRSRAPWKALLNPWLLGALNSLFGGSMSRICLACTSLQSPDSSCHGQTG